MKAWKRTLALTLSAVMMVGLLASCGGSKQPASSGAASTGSAASSGAASTGEDVGDPITLTFSIAAVPTDAHGMAQKTFKETLESISGGNMTVECYDSGTLYGQDTEHDALKNGDVDMIYSSASWLTDGSPWVSMFTAGYVFQSYEHMTKVMNGDIGKAPTKTIPYFNLEVPTELPGVDSGILDPRDTYADAAEWETKAKDLASRFVKNFAKYTTNEAGKALVAAGPVAE